MREHLPFEDALPLVTPSASGNRGVDEMMRPELKSPPSRASRGNLLFRIGVRHHDSPSGVPLKESREPLSRSVWLTENKNPAAIFFCSLPGDGNGVAGRWLNSVRASTDKRQTPPPPPPPSSSSSFVCFKRHLFGDLADGTARGFSRCGEARRMRGGNLHGEERGGYGVARLGEATFECTTGREGAFFHLGFVHLDIRDLFDKRQDLPET